MGEIQKDLQEIQRSFSDIFFSVFMLCQVFSHKRVKLSWEVHSAPAKLFTCTSDFERLAGVELKVKDSCIYREVAPEWLGDEPALAAAIGCANLKACSIQQPPFPFAWQLGDGRNGSCQALLDPSPHQRQILSQAKFYSLICYSNQLHNLFNSSVSYQ